MVEDEARASSRSGRRIRASVIGSKGKSGKTVAASTSSNSAVSPGACSVDTVDSANTSLESPVLKSRGSSSFNRRKPRSLRVKTDDDDDMCRPVDDDADSADEPLWTPGTGPAAGMDDLFTGSGSVLPGVSPGANGCLTSPGLGLGMGDYFQGGVVPPSSHGNGDVDMLRSDVTDSVLSAAEVASMMCATPSQVLCAVLATTSRCLPFALARGLVLHAPGQLLWQGTHLADCDSALIRTSTTDPGKHSIAVPPIIDPGQVTTERDWQIAMICT